MKIDKTLRLSYYHIDYEALDFLQCESEIDGEQHPESLCVAAYCHPSSDGIIVSTKHFGKPEYWVDNIDSLKDCMDFAISQGCNWICFTPDEPIIPELPVYDNDWYEYTEYKRFVGPKQKLLV